MEAAERHVSKTYGENFSKVSFLVFLIGEFRSELTFEKFAQDDLEAAERRVCTGKNSLKCAHD